MRPSRPKGSGMSLWSGLRVTAPQRVRTAVDEIAVYGLSGQREPALAEESKTCGSPVFDVICLQRIDEFDFALPDIHERPSPWAHRLGHRWLDLASFAPPHHQVRNGVPCPPDPGGESSAPYGRHSNLKDEKMTNQKDKHQRSILPIPERLHTIRERARRL